MTALALCPHCGHNFEADEPVQIGCWRLTPLSAQHHGQDMRLSPQETTALHTIAAARGEWVSREAIHNRINALAEPNIVSVVIAHIRAKLGRITPFEGAKGRGYRWNTQSLDHAPRHDAERLGGVSAPVHAPGVPHG